MLLRVVVPCLRSNSGQRRPAMDAARPRFLDNACSHQDGSSTGLLLYKWRRLDRYLSGFHGSQLNPVMANGWGCNCCTAVLADLFRRICHQSQLLFAPRRTQAATTTQWRHCLRHRVTVGLMWCFFNRFCSKFFGVDFVPELAVVYYC